MWTVTVPETLVDPPQLTVKANANNTEPVGTPKRRALLTPTGRITPRAYPPLRVPRTHRSSLTRDDAFTASSGPGERRARPVHEGFYGLPAEARAPSRPPAPARRRFLSHAATADGVVAVIAVSGTVAGESFGAVVGAEVVAMVSVEDICGGALLP